VKAQSPLLEVEGAGKRFRGRTVLRDGSFEACEGSVIALVGRNGTGKSTLLRIAIGRVRPDYGRVLFRGRVLKRHTLSDLAREGVLFLAQTGALVQALTVREHLEAMARVFQEPRGVARAVAELNLEHLLDRHPHELSGGEGRRAILGMALVRRPRCLLMEEPFSGVEPLDRPTVVRGLRTLTSAGAAVVISGHDVKDIFGVSDQIVWTTAGTTHFLGSPDVALEHRQFRLEYLGQLGD
jgi:ABC-type multidrug transport system ATPase subunit